MSKAIVFTNEADVKREVKKILKKHGIHPYAAPPVEGARGYYLMPSANAYGSNGTSDFIINIKGHFVAIETKYGRNQPTPLQQRFVDATNQTSGVACIVNEACLEQLDQLLSHHFGGL